MDQQQQKQLRVFGYGLPVILAVLSVRHGMKHGWDALSLSLGIAAVLFLFITLLAKPLLIQIFKSWMKAAGIIGSTVTAVILIILYYMAFTPIAYFLRIRGKDFMNRSWANNEESYWITRDSQRQQSIQEHTKQF